MKLRYTIAQESRRKAIAFDSVLYGAFTDHTTTKVQPVAYAQLFGFWLDLYNDRSGYRAEFGPYLSDAEAKRSGECLLAALDDSWLSMAAMEGER